MSDELLQKIYSAFSPAPLEPGQQDLYVDLDPVRGGQGIVQRLARTIRLSGGQPTCQVLTGHRGSGKSTELWQLRHELQEPSDDGKRYFVVQVQADDDLDRNDVDFPDVLIAIIRQLAAQLIDRANISLQPTYFKDRFAQLTRLLKTEISLDTVEFAVGIAKLSATIKNSPDMRDKVRALLEPDLNNWLVAANSVIGDAIHALIKQEYLGLVIIVDDLDKIITRPHPGSGGSTSEYLFVNRSAQLTDLQCHVIYTMPLELAYSHHEQTIKRLYGGHVPVIPMTKIATPPPKERTYPEGMKRFRQVIDKRLESAGATVSDAFVSNRVRDDLIKLSGGQPTELISLVREALVTEGLPIGTAALKRCREEILRSYRRQLRLDHWPILEEVRRTGQITRSKENEAAFRELIEGRAVLLYMNGDEWYGLNPAIEDLSPPVVLPPVVPQPVPAPGGSEAKP